MSICLIFLLVVSIYLQQIFTLQQRSVNALIGTHVCLRRTYFFINFSIKLRLSLIDLIDFVI